MLRTVRLYGAAGKRFGREFKLDVSSAAEATRALSNQIKGFREFVNARDFRIVCGSDLNRGLQLAEDDVTFGLPAGDIHIVPVTAGAKKGGLFKIIAGVFLLAAAFFIPVVAPGLAASMGVSTVGGMAFVGPLAAAGLGLIVQGVSQMIAAQKKKEEKDDSSYTIDGQLNVTEQGGPVALVYGRFGVGSTLISGGVTTTEYGGSSSSGSGDSGSLFGRKATGYVAFTAKPSVGDKITLNGVPFTFVSEVTNAYLQVYTGANASEAIANLLAEIQSSVDSRLKVAGYTRNNGKLVITYKTTGASGQKYTLKVSGPSVSSGKLTISNDTLLLPGD